MQARIKRQGDWALKCTSGHDLERRFIDTINDGFFEQLVLVPMRENITPDLGLCSAVLTLQVGLLGRPSWQRRAGAGLPRAHALTRHGACTQFCAVSPGSPVPVWSLTAHAIEGVRWLHPGRQQGKHPPCFSAACWGWCLSKAAARLCSPPSLLPWQHEGVRPQLRSGRRCQTTGKGYFCS